ncbi:TonB-dependent receptor [Teichococcus aestuarii]|uniref:TonB-dependent siderophore receptor n=1 Tax=Teichococcus aestuarii TaxID=568898 RepID=A0A2U1V9I9_9PROT|nr:TonB-dependent siderophore receptor [Pseudoroseomonas aestuarii]PWC30563.1 TonB-dependent siderophore receptor [Pseudoroseomonas aestuarii]
MTTQSGTKPPTSHAAWMAGLAMGLPGAALAQGAAAPEGGLVLPTVDVQGTAPANTLQRAAPVSRLPGSVQDTPQVINVIPREVLEQQNVTTLEQALRNVPGITASIGEGNGGVNGDQFRIRGFAAQNDIYTDGLRDFGAYTRDAFTYEDVSVIKGPSGFALGNGTVGGAVAVGLRTPRLGNSYSATATGGSGPYARGTLDINQQIGETTALRLNLMGQSSEVVGRDGVDSRRWGIAPSIAFGLGTDTTLTLHYQHYEYDNATDSGIPVVTAPGSTIGRPLTEYGLPRGTWYGLSSDRDEVTTDVFTARLNHTVNDWLTLANDTRVSFIDRDYASSIVSCAAASCVTPWFRNRSGTVTASGAGNPYHQESWAVQNVATATARFTTGPLRHELVGGIDLMYEDFERTGYGYTGTRPALSVFGGQGDIALDRGAPSYQRNGSNTTYAAFLSDRLWLTPEFSIIGGVRVSRFEVEYDTVTYSTGVRAEAKPSHTVVDPRASLVWEPAPNQTYYATYSTSTTPPGFLFSTQPFTASGFNSNFDPERNTLYEVGAKVGFLENRLGLYGSLYRIDKKNSQTPDPNGDGSTFIQTSDEQRNQGIEIGLTGQVTPAWMINASYTAMDSETTKSTTAANVGKKVQFVPDHAASLWTTYELGAQTPWNLTLGGGVTWRDKVFLNAANTAEVPAALTVDALVSHRINDNLRVQVNGYNLGNALNYDGLWANRVIPSAGRTILFTLAADF